MRERGVSCFEESKDRELLEQYARYMHYHRHKMGGKWICFNQSSIKDFEKIHYIQSDESLRRVE